MTYTVKAAGGGDFTTIQAAVTAHCAAGNTIVVYAGTYNEQVSIACSGSAGLPFTVKANAGDTVTVQRFSFSGRSYLTIGGSAVNEGFVITATKASGIRLIEFDTSDHIIIQNNNIGGTSTDGGGAAGIQCIRNSVGAALGSSYVSILNNNIHWCGIDTSIAAPYDLGAAISAIGDHWLIDGNTMAHVSDGQSPYGSYMVIRNNTFGPNSCVDVGETDGMAAGSACDVSKYHVDFIDHECVDNTWPAFSYSLIEGNTILKNNSPNGHFALMQQGSTCTTETNSIIRFNVTNNVGTSFVLDNATLGHIPNLKMYNNTIANTTFPDCTVSSIYGTGVTNAASINNLYYTATASPGTNFCNSGAQVVALDANSSPTFVEHNDLGYNATGCTTTPCFATQFTGTTGTLTSNPTLTNGAAASFDGRLLAGSPALVAGGALTTANGSGSSATALIVTDAAYFSDGSGIVSADWICVGTVSNCSQITAVNYSTNVITLLSGLLWANGASVWLKKDSSGTDRLTGAAPNIGALGASTAPAVTLSASSHNFGTQNTGTTSGAFIFTVTNSGTATLTFSATPLIGGTNATDFAITSNTCGTTGSTLTAGARP